MSTVYQDHIDQERLEQLKPYIVKPSNLSYSDVRKNVNYNVGVAYGPDFTVPGKWCSVDTPITYHNFLTKLKNIPGTQFATMHEALQRKPQGNEKLCTIRHDLDGDLIAAQQQAEIENNLGIPTSYYILHTAPYYGLFNNDIFYRNEESLQAYSYMQSLGHEMALHTDSMTIYQDLNIDGSKAITTELEWLRNNGINIVGSTAHNSFGVYGCNNFSIFKGRPMNMHFQDDLDTLGVIHNGKWAPVHVLDESELGLEYEANEMFWQNETPVFYACLITQNNWNVAYNKEDAHNVNRSPDKKQRWLRNTSHADLLKLISEFPSPAYINLVVHPLHYGLRINPLSDPWMAHGEEKIEDDGVTAISYEDWDGLYNNVISKKNEYDTRDRCIVGIEGAEFKILVLGGNNIETEFISVDSKYSQVLARQVVLNKTYKSCKSVGVACSKKTLTEIDNLIKSIIAEYDFDLIILALSPNDVDIWQKLEYANILLMNGNNVICLIEPSIEDLDKDELVQFTDKVKHRFNGETVDPSTALKEDSLNHHMNLYQLPSIWSSQSHSITGKLLANYIR